MGIAWEVTYPRPWPCMSSVGECAAVAVAAITGRRAALATATALVLSQLASLGRGVGTPLVPVCISLATAPHPRDYRPHAGPKDLKLSIRNSSRAC